jgi:hypothetical protein
MSKLKLEKNSSEKSKLFGEPINLNISDIEPSAQVTIKFSEPLYSIQ